MHQDIMNATSLAQSTETAHTSKLIDSTFDVERAKTILSQLITHKISFHSLEKFSNEERFGDDRDHSQKRIKELSAEKSLLIDWLNQAEGGKKVKVSCLIEMELVD